VKPQRVLTLVHRHLVPPTDIAGIDLATAPWKTEHDVIESLRTRGHEVLPLGVQDDLGVVRSAIETWKPTIVFNLLESFDDVTTFDMNVVSYLELMKVPYTGCNPRGLLIARDKALSKQLLAYHRIPFPEFMVFRRNKAIRIPPHMQFPVIVKSLTYEASVGISQASVVNDVEKLRKRVEFIHESVGSDAIAERYIDGRELYVGVLGNDRIRVFPVWEMTFEGMIEGDNWPIATERVKWNPKYQTKHGIQTNAAQHLPEGFERGFRAELVLEAGFETVTGEKTDQRIVFVKRRHERVRFKNQRARRDASNPVEHLDRRPQVVEDAEEEDEIERPQGGRIDILRRASLMLDFGLEHLVRQ